MFLDYKLDIADDSIWLISDNPGSLEDYPFTMNEVGYFNAKEEYYTTRSGIEGMLIFYTLSGEGIVNYNNKTHILPSNSVTLIDCSKYHSYNTNPDNAENWKFFWMHFNSKFMPSYFEALEIEIDPVIQIGKKYDLRDYFETAINYFERPAKNHYNILSNCVSNVLTKTIEIKASEYKENPLHKEIVENTINYIKNNFNQDLNLDDLSREVNLSKYYLINIFKESMKTTPYRYLIQTRITEAKKLLQTTDYKMVVISKMIGFGDESNFNRTFKRIVGETPLQYRNKFL